MESTPSLEKSIQSVTSLQRSPDATISDLAQIDNNAVSLGLMPSSTTESVEKDAGTGGETSSVDPLVEEPTN